MTSQLIFYSHRAPPSFSSPLPPVPHLPSLVDTPPSQLITHTAATTECTLSHASALDFIYNLEASVSLVLLTLTLQMMVSASNRHDPKRKRSESGQSTSAAMGHLVLAQSCRSQLRPNSWTDRQCSVPDLCAQIRVSSVLCMVCT